MERVSQQLVQEIKEILQRPSFTLSHLQMYWNDLQHMEFDVAPDWPWVFQKVYLHACLKGKKDVADWLREVFEHNSDPIQKIAYRQTYAYGNHLLQKHKAS